MIKVDMMIYDIHTKRNKDVKRMKILAIDELTGERFELFDKLLTEVEKEIYELLIELGKLKEV